jgi:hypothetical protein
MRQLLIAFFLLFAAPTWAETRDPVNHFFQSKFGDLRLICRKPKAGQQGDFCFSKWRIARFASA